MTGRRTLITGAGGFVGRAVTARMLASLSADERLILVDRELAASTDSRVETIVGDLADPEVLRPVLATADAVIHLAAIPGRAAEADYALSLRVNLVASLTLLETLAARPSPARLIYASSIAVFGAPLPGQIDDATLPLPSLTYGAHKLMVETALANLTRLGRLEGLALRLPSLVARPAQADGLKSAFMSDVFHALAKRVPFVSPVGPHATLWLMSAGQAADDLVHALAATPPHRALTLPALRVSMTDLVGAICRLTGASETLVSYNPDLALEAAFGRLPPLAATAAERLGFRHDGNLDILVARTLASLNTPDETA